MPTLLHHGPYLFMGSLLSPAVAQGDHLQSHLHNDNNKVAWSALRVCVCVCASRCMCLCASLLLPVTPAIHLSILLLSHSSLVHTHPPPPPKDSSPPGSCPIPSPTTQRPRTCPGMTLQAHRKMTLTAHRTKGDDCVTRVLLPSPPKPTNPSLAHTPHWARSFFFLHYSNFTGLGSFYTQCPPLCPPCNRRVVWVSKVFYRCREGSEKQ